MKMVLRALWLPKVGGVARDIAYFLLMLGMKMVAPALGFPKVWGYYSLLSIG